MNLTRKSTEYKYKVRGPPWAMNIIKVRKTKRANYRRKKRYKK